MQQDMQAYAEQLKTDADRSGKSILVADNAARSVIAWYTTEGELRRSPGSAIKPFIYAAAMEEGSLVPCTPLLDERTDFGNYRPSNYNDNYRGWIPAREALSESRNLPAVKVLNELTPSRGCAYLRRFGLPVKEEDETLSLALGGLRDGFTARELAGAYAALCEEGKYAPLAFIRKVESKDGEILYERDIIPTRSVSENTAALTIDMMRTAAKTGTAKKLSVLPFDIAAKTGTNGTEAGNSDAWTVACTTQHTVAVWMGNADNSLTDITGGGLPCHYAMLLSKKLYEKHPPLPFMLPATVRMCDIDLASYESEHIVRNAAPNQPKNTVFQEMFREEFLPQEVSPIYAVPHDEAVLSVNNSSVNIELCHTEYYDYEIKRETSGKIELIFDGHLTERYTDRTVKKNLKYRYRIRPYYTGENGERVWGEELVTPSILAGSGGKIPDEWWKQ